MLTIQWNVKLFHQLTVDQLFELLQLRVNVFVVEQRCAYPELDVHDRHVETRHLLGQDESGHLLAYARLLASGLTFSDVSMGRCVVRQGDRGKGAGHQLLRAALDEIQAKWPGHAIRISAQDYLQKFYEQYGFMRVSDTYLEDGISHIEMVKDA